MNGSGEPRPLRHDAGSARIAAIAYKTRPSLDLTPAARFRCVSHDGVHSSGLVMISRRWRVHLAYFAMSAFLAWHTVAMLLAPVPNNNATVGAFRALFHPYLAIVGLDNSWDFFAPLGVGYTFRYVITDARGNDIPQPIEQFYWFQPSQDARKFTISCCLSPIPIAIISLRFSAGKTRLNPIPPLLARQEDVYGQRTIGRKERLRERVRHCERPKAFAAGGALPCSRK